MRTWRRSLLALAPVLLGAVPRGGRAGQGQAVDIRLFQFQPSTLEVPVGTRVTWTNADDIGHTVTAGEPDHADGRFTGTLSAKGTRFAFTFERPGVYGYFCDRHHFMRGEIRVTQP